MHINIFKGYPLSAGCGIIYILDWSEGMDPLERYLISIIDTDKLIRLKSISTFTKQRMWVRLKLEREIYNAAN